MLTRLAAVAAAAAAAPAYTVFRPQGYDSLQHLDEGRGPDPLSWKLHLTQVAAESDLCEGVHDVLALTLPAPIAGDIDLSEITVTLCPIREDGDDSPQYFPRRYQAGCDNMRPTCARLQLDGQQHERRTVLLFGQFVKFEDHKATHAIEEIDLWSVTFLIDGKQVSAYGEDTSGQGFVSSWTQLASAPSVVGYGEGPFLADTALLDLSKDPHTADTDPNGCAARHPSATYAVRLLFASAVHERAEDGSLAPLATSTTAAALFSVRTGGDGEGASPDRVVGVAGAAGGSAVDVCIEGAAAEPQVKAVVINCTASAPLSPGGFACDRPIMAFLSSWVDGRAGRDPSTFSAGHSIEFCLSDPEDCPGVAPQPPHYDYDDYSGYDDDYHDRRRGADSPGGEGAKEPQLAVANVLAGAAAVLAAGAILAVCGQFGIV